VRMIYDLYNSGLTDWGIATHLTKLGIKSPGESMGITIRKMPPGTWITVTVRSILINEAYTGVYHYGRQIGKGGKGGKRPADQQIKIAVPAIVAGPMWQAAQARREYNKQMSARNTKHEYLLRGLVKCGCGRAMSPNMKKAGPWYRCCSHVYRHASLCDERNANGKVLEAFAWTYALDIITERDQLVARLREAQAEALKAQEPQREKLTAIMDDLKDCETEAGQIAAAMSAIPQDEQSTSVVFRQLQLRAVELDKRYKTQTQKRDTLQAEIEAATITDESILDIATFSGDAIDGLNNPTFDVKRRWLEYLKIKVEVKEHKATASTWLKVEARTIDLQTS